MGEVPDESIYGLRAVSDEQRDSLEWTEGRTARPGPPHRIGRGDRTRPYRGGRCGGVPAR